MNTNTAKKIMFAGITAMAVTWFAGTAHALKAPHDYNSQVNCSNVGANKGCHSKANFWKGMTSINSGCINTTAGCHRSGGLAVKKQLSINDASNRFGRIAQVPAGSKQSSHGWKIPFKNSTSGLRAGVPSHQMLSEKNWYNSVNKTNITCTRCHRAMGDSLAKGYKFLRESETGNYICFNCHSARRIDNVRDYNSSVASQTLHYSHPVEVNYSTARAAKPDFFNATFRLATGYDESARPRLYTTHASAQGGTKKGAVVCQSCHGPMHAADSNPYTFDSLSAYSRLGKYSSSAGNLLRAYPIVGPRASNNLCLSCHKVQTHQSFMCGRCHTPHKKAGENNRYLILENISTPSSGKRSVVFTSRSEMAARFAAGYTSTQARTVRQASNRICQVCHMNTRFHRNYSSPGGTVYRTHNMTDEGDSSKKYKFCPDCHKHTGGFTPSGCGTCHNFPPNDVINSTASFKHAKHTNGNVEPTPSNTFWKTGKATDNRSDTSYGFSCTRCHSPWPLYTAFGISSDGYKGKNHYGSDVISQKIYTADVGFKIRTAINARPWNPLGSYLYATGGPIDSPGNGQWRGAGAGATCYNLYCHGNFYNGYTSNNPAATGTQACGKCHGASNTDPPGKTGGVNYGAHPRHVGSANSQQYGSGTPNFRCNACHSLTSKYNNETTVSSRKYHVNGIVNIKFDNGSSSNFRVGNGSSNYGGYGGYDGYTSRRPAMSNPFSNSRPAYTTCRLIYCHSNGSRTQGNYSAPNNAGINPSSPWPNWSSSRNFTTTMSIGGYTMKTRCARCHGNAIYKGITAAMPNYTSNDPSYTIKGPKENSHRKHVIENKFRCNVCHSATINSANNSIVSTQNHVNKFYNISIIATFRSNGVGNNFNSSAKTCSDITCHAGKATPVWGSKIGCANCHLSNTGDNDKRIKVSNAFQSFSESAPKIYSAQWAGTGHGRSSATQYGGGNYGANKVCTNCHLASVAHGTSGNPFRLYTAAGRPNRVCEGCHGTNAWVSGGSNKQGIQTHASSVVQPAKFNFAIKCIDCHDPHGDNNTRFMMHSTVARPLITGTRAESSNQYGQRQTNVTSSNVDFNQNLYSSDYARKYKASKICQVCHTRTVDRDNSSPTYLKGRFRWYSGSDKAHGSGKCTSCHSHSSGFKGAGCNGCHGFPPINVQTILSGAGRTLEVSDNRQRPSGNTGSEAATAGAHQKHFGNFSSTYASSKQTICSFCHQGGMYATGSPSSDIEIGFKAFTDYSGTSQIYRGQAAVSGGYYGYSGIGMNYDGSMRCTVKCHGGGSWLSNSLGNYSSPRWNVSNSVRCGKCHGAKKESGAGSWPTSNRHAKHAGTSGTGYDFMCRVCHADTVMGTATTLNKTNHVNGQATFRFYTGTFTGSRVWGGSVYNGGDTNVNSGFGRCENLYCHSRGTKALQSYTGIAYPNYTAKWDASNLPASATEKCSYCHGSKKSAGGYAGITSAMPNQVNQAHKKHVVDNGLKCSFCHAATVDSNNAIVSTTNHVNKFKNISIVATFRQGLTMYSSSLDATNKTCKNVRCHAGRKTPNWTTSTGINCTDCHYSNTSDTDNFAWTNFSGTAAKIYSTEWAKRGHGKARTSSKYAFSNNSGAAKNCTNCHKSAVSHNATNNYFRLLTSNPDRLCLACHGIGSERLPSIGFSRVTGIQSHSWANISTAGYASQANGNNIKKASLYGGWNFGQHDGGDQKKVKCVDCHDPHGDSNNFMIHAYPNYSGSDRVGRPAFNGVAYNITTNVKQMIFTAVGGPQMNWSSYTRPTNSSQGLGICQRCHSVMSNTTAMTNHNKNLYSGHNAGNRCTNCHMHKQGFKPSGCEGCHGYPPPKGPNGWNDSMTGYSSLHTPHAKNPRSRPINGKDASGSPSSDGSWQCVYCHDDKNANNQASDTMGQGLGYVANMNNLTSQTGYNGYNPRAKFTSTVNKNTADDKCSKVACHTPRYYERGWKKPTGCDNCHGYRNKVNGEAFQIQTTGSHKIHVNYSTPGIAGTDFKKYGLACSNCHYNWQPPINNYSTHYSGFVNITANGDVNTKGGQFYGRGRYFKGFTTGGELNNDTNVTCSKVYCHGNFTNGTTTNAPKWRKGAMSTTCGSCHKAKTAKVAGWADGSLMPESHPKHEGTAQYNFACARCHVRTVTNNTTIQFNWSTHVNGRKDVYFNTATTVDVGGKFTVNNTAATLGGGNRACKNVYCHSRGTDRIAPYNTRTSFANFTAQWGDNRGGYKTGKGNKAKCNYCHGNRAYSGTTSAMPNYSGTLGAGYGVTAKANSHRVHVVGNGFVCSTCHNSIAMNNTSISDRTRHANGFYNISITPGRRKPGGQKVYSMVYNGSGGTCMNNTCHGDSKPQWGNPSTANCKACHFSGTKDTDDYARKDNGTKAELYSSEWRRKGHGQFAQFTSRNINRCERCHKPSAPHNYAQSPVTNPFRLWTSVPDKLCAGCHGSATERTASWNANATNVDYITHSKAATGGDAAWNTHSSVTGKGPKCIDCHDPHGDKNRKMIHSYINHSGSDKFGRPKGRPWTEDGQIGYSTAAMMTFTTWGNAQPIWSSFANDNPSRSICRRCHTPKAQDAAMGNKPTGNEGEMTKANYAVSHQAHTNTCTAACHTHKSGFKGGGESSGNSDCSTCHGSGDLFEKMQATNNYHHVMKNTSATGNPKYPTVSSFGPTAQNSPARRCLMCHVDHNVFRPDINTDGTGGRAKNLRWSVFDKGNTGINTDFWPAKRKNSTGRTGVDSGTGNYSSTYPIYGPSSYNGVCISCHKNVQYKNTTLVNDDIQVQRARNFSVNLYTSSSHNFQVISSTFAFGSGSSKTRFRGNCTKCHRTPDNDFNKLSKSVAQSGRFPVALHDKNVPSLLMNIATSSSKPMIEQLCYKCHDTLARSSGGPGSMDYYSSIKMNSGAKMIKTAVTGKRYVKPIEDASMAGMHKIDEYYKASDTVAENSNPSVLWNYSTGAAGGVGRHIECVDCHNTHGGNASIRRLVGAPFRGKLNTQQASYFNYTRETGNKIAGAQKGVWGVQISYGSTRGTTPAFTKIAQVTYQYEVCLKCHSRYAYGTNPPGTPDGLPDPAGTTVVPFDNLNPDVAQADISKMINPNNYGYHPIFRKGRNQPPKTANTANWPAAKSNWMYKDRFNNKTAFISVSGLSWNFVPPFSQHSLLACTDCHVADNSGKAIQTFYTENATPTTGGGGTWTIAPTAANIGTADKDAAVVSITGTAATLQVNVTDGGAANHPGPSPDTNGLSVVVYGKSTGSTTNNRKQTIGAYSGGTPGTLIWSGLVSFGSGAIGRFEYTAAWTTQPWTTVEGYSAKLTTNTATASVTVDYLGLEVVYTTTADVRGPHGSMQRWILTDIDKDIWFDADNNNALAYSGTDRPNSTTLAYTGDDRIFCWNCHRRDVYGYNPTPAKKLYSRFDHTSATNEPWDGSVENQWGIKCMNCHAGGGIGEIHGSFANSTTDVAFSGVQTRVNLGRPRGVRLLNGAAFNLNVTANECYNNDATTTYASSCAQHWGGVSPVTNYSYTSW